MISTFYQPAPNGDPRPLGIPARRDSGIFPGWGPKV
jgi:hypothetical protein